MGVDHSFAAGYGIVFECDSITNDLIKKVGYFPSYTEYKSHLEWAAAMQEDYEDDLVSAAHDYNGLEDVIDFICREYGFEYATAGSSYSGELCWLVGGGITVGRNDYWFEEVTPEPAFSGYAEVDEKLAKLKSDLGLDLKVAHYAGMHVY